MARRTRPSSGQRKHFRPWQGDGGSGGPAGAATLDCQTLRENRQRLDSRRVILTHMSADMLRRRDEADMECANDGQVIVL